jgi:hypothetical protein
MLEIKPIESLEQLSQLKAQYFALSTTAFEVNALIYQLSTAVANSIKKDPASSITMTLADQSQLTQKALTLLDTTAVSALGGKLGYSQRTVERSFNKVTGLTIDFKSLIYSYF